VAKSAHHAMHSPVQPHDVGTATLYSPLSTNA
jgi:hypothetical protein